jgi:malate dehydrogenase
MEGSKLVIVVAGRGRKPGMTRKDLMNINAKIVRSVVKEVARYAPDCKLMIVTNPVDVMTFLARKESGLPPNRVFGMGNILDTLQWKIRTAWLLASMASPWFLLLSMLVSREYLSL